MGKLLYFQGSRFCLVFLWHFPEQNHGACFSCVCDTTVVLYRYRDCYTAQIQGGGVKLGNMEVESNQEGFFHYLLFYFQEGDVKFP